MNQRSALMLARLQSGDHSPEVREWLRELSKEQLISLIGKTPRRRDAQNVSDALAQALLDVHPPNDTGGLPRTCVLRIAEFLGGRGVERCVELFESLLVHGEEGRTDAMYALHGLAKFYESRGDLAKAAETLLRAKDYTDASVSLGCSAVDAARAYARMGDEEAAERVYDQVAQYGYGWATGVASADHANLLMRRGQHDAARRLLAAPVTGKYADQIRPVLLQCLGRSHYLTGDFAQAREYCRRAIEQYHSLENPLKGEGLEASLGGARACLAWMSRWNQSPIWTDTKRLLLISTEPGLAAKCHFFVYTPPDPEVPLEFVAEPSWIMATVTEVCQEAFTTRCRVEVASGATAPPGRFDGRLIVTSLRHPNSPLAIQLRIVRKGGLRWSHGSVFFGFVKPEESPEKAIRIKSLQAFRVRRVSCDGDWLRASATPTGPDGRVWEIAVVANAHPPYHAGVLRGVVHVHTDVDGEEVMELPCYAHVMRD